MDWDIVYLWFFCGIERLFGIDSLRWELVNDLIDVIIEFWVLFLLMRSDCLFEEEVNELKVEFCFCLWNEDIRFVLIGGVILVNKFIDCLKIKLIKEKKKLFK